MVCTDVVNVYPVAMTKQVVQSRRLVHVPIRSAASLFWSDSSEAEVQTAVMKSSPAPRRSRTMFVHEVSEVHVIT